VWQPAKYAGAFVHGVRDRADISHTLIASSSERTLAVFVPAPGGFRQGIVAST
jgi:hypothetical protein